MDILKVEKKKKSCVLHLLSWHAPGDLDEFATSPSPRGAMEIILQHRDDN
jgi:hypothetical protein